MDSHTIMHRTIIDLNIAVGTGAQTLFLTPTTYAQGNLSFNLLPGNFYNDVILNMAASFDLVEYLS